MVYLLIIECVTSTGRSSLICTYIRARVNRFLGGFLKFLIVVCQRSIRTKGTKGTKGRKEIKVNKTRREEGR
jgi:hypothetical protein